MYRLTVSGNYFEIVLDSDTDEVVFRSLIWGTSFKPQDDTITFYSYVPERSLPLKLSELKDENGDNIDTYSNFKTWINENNIGVKNSGGTAEPEEEVLLWTEDFESYSVSDAVFDNITNTGSKDMIAYTGATPTASTGALSAHEGNNYVYIESSSTSMGDTFSVETSVLDASSNSYRFEYFYHYYSEYVTTNVLRVQGYDGSSWQDINTYTGAQQVDNTDPYLQGIASSSGFTNSDFKFRIFFEITDSTSSFANDWCFDYLQLYRE